MATEIIDLTELDQRQTAALTDRVLIRPDPFALLDHRVKDQVTTRKHALPGHYIGLNDEDGNEHLLPLADAIIHVGRATAADLRFDDVHVSRRHAILVRYGDHARVLDDRSSAGTFVNGSRIVATDITDGDVVRLGPIAFTYVRIR